MDLPGHAPLTGRPPPRLDRVAGRDGAQAHRAAERGRVDVELLAVDARGVPGGAEGRRIDADRPGSGRLLDDRGVLDVDPEVEGGGALAVGDWAALEAKLGRWLDDAELRRRAGDAALSYVKSNLGAGRRNAELILGLLRE